MKRISTRILFTAFTLAILNGVVSCNAKKHMITEYTEENKAIPPEFGRDPNTTLVLVLQNRNSYDRFLKKAVIENYKGDYVLITKEQMKQPPYDDVAKYRYVFDYDYGAVNPRANHKRFHIYDRLDKRRWESGAEFPAFGKAIEIYITNLETKRKSTQQ
jgi:hypothetical protein